MTDVMAAVGLKQLERYEELCEKRRTIVKKYDEDEAFERRHISGYCDGYTKEIVVCDMNTCKGWEHEEKRTIEECQKSILRHEIVHAFFNESGLMGSSLEYEGGWSNNEELVDWIALQGGKIYTAWKQADCI